MKYKINNKKIIHNGFFKLHELKFTHQKHDKSWSPEITREIFGGAHVAAVLPFDPIKKKIILLNQFRVGLLSRKHNPMMTEIVAGMIDRGESPREAAKRECYEETGCNVKKIIDIYGRVYGHVEQ